MVSVAREILLHDKVRFVFTVASLGLATVLTVWGIGVLFGTLGESVNLIDRAQADLWVADKDAAHAADPSLVPSAILRQARRLDGVRYACGLNQLMGNLALAKNVQVQVVGIDPACPLFRPWDVVAGNLDGLGRGDTIVVDDFALKGSATQVGDVIELNDHELRIVAITHYNKAFFTSYAFVNRETFAEIGGVPEHSNFVAVRLEPGADGAQIARRLTSATYETTVFTTDEFRAATVNMMLASGMGAGIGTMVFVGIVISFLGIALTIYTATMEQLREFAILKAMGATKWKIFGIVLEQAIIETVASFVWGVICSLGLDRFLRTHVGMTSIFPIAPIAAAFAAMLILSIAGALLSIRKAVTVDPMLVFRG